jgi:hypothetical protein
MKSKTLLRSWNCFIAALFTIIIGSGCIQNNSESPQLEFTTYTDPDWGISFEYPSTMVPQSKTDSKIENNEQLSSITIQLSDRRETSLIFIQIVDDPILVREPDWYPPSETLLEIYAAGDLGILRLEKTDENSKAVKAALESANSLKIAGFPSIEYKAFLNDSEYGYIYVRGAATITPKRVYTLMTIGGLSKESPIHDVVKPERVDEIWERFLDTILIKE